VSPLSLATAISGTIVIVVGARHAPLSSRSGIGIPAAIIGAFRRSGHATAATAYFAAQRRVTMSPAIALWFTLLADLVLSDALLLSQAGVTTTSALISCDCRHKIWSMTRLVFETKCVIFGLLLSIAAGGAPPPTDVDNTRKPSYATGQQLAAAL
ncbi:hypothetical protein Dimus_031486, partial [Dionaea muscipula]